MHTTCMIHELKHAMIGRMEEPCPKRTPEGCHGWHRRLLRCVLVGLPAGMTFGQASRAPWVYAYRMFVSCQCAAVGCVDIPGAVLNWWTTNEHPQKASIQKPSHSTCMRHTASQQGTDTTLELSNELSAACHSCPKALSVFSVPPTLQRWSFTHAVWQTELIPMTEAERTDGEGALGRQAMYCECGKHVAVHVSHTWHMA